MNDLIDMQRDRLAVQTVPSFATFWAGRLVSPFEAACMASFVRQNYAYTVYSYDKIENLPPGVRLEDAALITEADNVRRYLIRGLPNLSHFTDLFRYKLFNRTPHIWVDTDMLLLRPLALGSYDALLAREDERSICGAIMRLDSSNPHLAELIQRTEALRDKELVWGETGPRLLTATFRQGDVLAGSHGPAMFFPIHYNDFWKAFLPEFRDECEALCGEAATLHLWNDRVVKLGVWKRFAPPTGSFLESQFATNGSLSLFDDVYPADIMRNMVENWRYRCEGGDIGLGQWLRRAVPSLQLTLRRRMNRPH
jgi:hypothetical protein